MEVRERMDDDPLYREDDDYEFSTDADTHPFIADTHTQDISYCDTHGRDTRPWVPHGRDRSQWDPHGRDTSQWDPHGRDTSHWDTRPWDSGYRDTSPWDTPLLFTPTRRSQRCARCRRKRIYDTMTCRKCESRRASTGPGEQHWSKVLQTREGNYNMFLLPCDDDRRNVHVEFEYKCAHCSRQQQQYRQYSGCGSFIRTLLHNIRRWFSEKRRVRASSVRYKPAHAPLTRVLRRLSSGRASRRPILDPDPTPSPSPGLSLPNPRYLHRGSHASTSNSSFSNIPDITLSRPDHTPDLSPYLIHTPIDASRLSLSSDSGVEVTAGPRLSFSNTEPIPRLRVHLETESTHAALRVTTSCPSWSGTKQFHPQAAVRSASWPILGRRNFDIEETADDAVFNELVCFRKKLLASDDVCLNRLSIGDCTIPYKDIEFVSCVRVGRRTMTHIGRWHGDVAIHVYSDLSEREAEEFLDEVAKMSMIRHDNIALFMGACVEPPHCIITCVPRGTSLHNQLHMSSEKISLETKLGIIRQISLGMGYLHARGIVLRKLNTNNIFLEPKVRLCLMDHGMAEAKHDRSDRACLRRGQLTYIAPEILCNLKVVPPRLIGDITYTKYTDVYAFGTVVFEILACRFPSLSSSTHCTIWQVCSGKRRAVTELQCVASIKNLIAECWSQNSASRPEFHEISKELDNTALRKRHATAQIQRVFTHPTMADTALRKRHSSDPESVHMSNYGGCTFLYNIK